MPQGDLLLAIAGGALCLFGFALYMLGLRLLGVVLGGGLGAVIAAIINSLTDLDQTTTLVLVIGCIVVGAGVGYYFVKAAHRFLVLLLGAGLGFALANSVLADLGGIWSDAWVPFVAAILGAILFSLLFRYGIILVTVFAGANLLYEATDEIWVWLVAFVLGLIVQTGAFRMFGLGRRE